MAGKWLFRAAVLPVLVVVGAVGAWYFAVGRMEAELSDWRTARQAEGWRITHGAPVRAGFPLHAKLRLGAVTVEAPSGLGWQAEEATLRYGITDIAAVHLLLEGRQALRHAGGVSPVQADGLSLRVMLATPELYMEALRLRAQNVALSGVTGRLTNATAQFTAATVQAPGLPGVEDAAVEARVNTPLATTASAWQAAGGQLRVDRMEFRTGTVRAEFTGQFGLDRALQPEGYGGLSVTNAAEAIGMLSSAGLISRDMVPPLRAVVAMTSRVPVEGGAPRLDLPIEVRNRRLIAARMPLLILPPLDWR
jgi:hypothetical protein